MKNVFELLANVKGELKRMGYDDLLIDLKDLTREVEERESFKLALESNPTKVLVEGNDVIMLVDENDKVDFRNYSVEAGNPIIINSNKTQYDAISSAYDILIDKYIYNKEDILDGINEDEVAEEIIEKMVATKPADDNDVELATIVEEPAKEELLDTPIISGVSDTVTSNPFPQIKEVSPSKPQVKVHVSEGATPIGDGVEIPNKFLNNKTFASVDISKSAKGSINLTKVISGEAVKELEEEKKEEVPVKGNTFVFGKDGLTKNGELVFKGLSSAKKEEPKAKGTFKLNIDRNIAKEKEFNIGDRTPEAYKPDELGMYMFVLSAGNELIPITSDEAKVMIEEKSDDVIGVYGEGYECLTNDIPEERMKLAIKNSKNLNHLPDDLRNALVEYANE